MMLDALRKAHAADAARAQAGRRQTGQQATRRLLPLTRRGTQAPALAGSPAARACRTRLAAHNKHSAPTARASANSRSRAAARSAGHAIQAHDDCQA